MLPLSFSKQTNANRVRGFTLVEVMVAISLLVIVMASVYGVFHAVSMTKQRLDGDSRDFHLARVLFDRLGRELHGTYFRPLDSTTLLRGGINEQGESFLELTTTGLTPLSRSGTGIGRVDYRLAEDVQPDREGQVLLRREQARFSADKAIHPEMMKMASGLKDIKFRFFADGQWYEQWDAGEKGLPAMVEVQIMIVRKEGHPTIPFVTTYELPRMRI